MEVVLRTGESHVEFWQRDALVSADAHLHRVGEVKKDFSSKKVRTFERQERLADARQDKRTRQPY